MPFGALLLDSLSTHKNQRAAEALCKRGSWFLILPAYSSGRNPIEMAFSKLKANLRRIDTRTFDALFEALGDICDMFHPDECRNFLKAGGNALD